MRSAVLSLVLFATALAANASPARYKLWEGAPLGIAITRCDYSTRGVRVKFITDIDPPYVVGVYRPGEENLARRFPVAEVETDMTEVFFPGDFTDVTLFVQVLAKSVVDRYAEDEIGRRMMTRGEWLNYIDCIRNAAPFVNTNANVTFETETRNCLNLIEDYTWTGFVKTAETNLHFTLQGRRAEPDVGSITTNIVQDVLYTNIVTLAGTGAVSPSVETNVGVYATDWLDMPDRHVVTSNKHLVGLERWMTQDTYHHPLHNDYETYVTNYLTTVHMVDHEYSFSLRGADVSRGTGFRIMMFEDSGVCQAQRAYSARTNMSDTVVLPRGFRALSSHNGYVYTTDWEGRRYFQRVTNRVDHVIY